MPLYIDQCPPLVVAVMKGNQSSTRRSKQIQSYQSLTINLTIINIYLHILLIKVFPNLG